MFSHKLTKQINLFHHEIVFTKQPSSQVTILTEKENIVKLSKPVTWIKVNNDFRMYYITNYDLVGWKKLYHQLVDDHTVFTTTGD